MVKYLQLTMQKSSIQSKNLMFSLLFLNFFIILQFMRVDKLQEIWIIELLRNYKKEKKIIFLFFC